MACIEREKAISVIERKQKELCPVGMYGRRYLYGTDREKYDAWEEIIDELNRIPASDVTQVVHGRWKVIHKKYQFTGGGNPVYVCSECEWVYGATLVPRYNYCPNCGAKMGGETDD